MLPQQCDDTSINIKAASDLGASNSSRPKPPIPSGKLLYECKMERPLLGSHLGLMDHNSTPNSGDGLVYGSRSPMKVLYNLQNGLTDTALPRATPEMTFSSRSSASSVVTKTGPDCPTYYDCRSECHCCTDILRYPQSEPDSVRPEYKDLSLESPCDAGYWERSDQSSPVRI
jgi:hypothetical protein